MSEIKTVSDAFNVLVARLISQSDQTQITAFLEELKEAKFLMIENVIPD